MLDTILDSPLSSWLQLDTDATDHIVISSRIRLARNFDGILFTIFVIWIVASFLWQ